MDIEAKIQTINALVLNIKKTRRISFESVEKGGKEEEDGVLVNEKFVPNADDAVAVSLFQGERKFLLM